MVVDPVWVNGNLLAAATARVRVDDHGLVVGDGVFETIRTRRGRPFAVRRHLDRLRRSAAGLRLNVPTDDDTLRAAIDATLGGGDSGGGLDRLGGEARIRVTVTGGPSPLGSGRGVEPPTVIVAAAPLGARHDTAAVAVVPWPRNERGATAGLKTTSYAENVIALDHARRHGADEAIFGNTVGKLCEGTGSNVFVVLDDVVLTPPLHSGCLAGVTRALVLEAGLAEEADVDLATFTAASEAFLTSTTRDVQPIVAIDGRTLAVGEHTAKIAAAFEAWADADLDP